MSENKNPQHILGESEIADGVYDGDSYFAGDGDGGGEILSGDEEVGLGLFDVLNFGSAGVLGLFRDAARTDSHVAARGSSAASSRQTAAQNALKQAQARLAAAQAQRVSAPPPAESEGVVDTLLGYLGTGFAEILGAGKAKKPSKPVAGPKVPVKRASGGSKKSPHLEALKVASKVIDRADKSGKAAVSKAASYKPSAHTTLLKSVVTKVHGDSVVLGVAENLSGKQAALVKRHNDAMVKHSRAAERTKQLGKVAQQKADALRKVVSKTSPKIAAYIKPKIVAKTKVGTKAGTVVGYASNEADALAERAEGFDEAADYGNEVAGWSEVIGEGEEDLGWSEVIGGTKRRGHRGAVQASDGAVNAASRPVVHGFEDIVLGAYAMTDPDPLNPGHLIDGSDDPAYGGGAPADAGSGATPGDSPTLPTTTTDNTTVVQMPTRDKPLSQAESQVTWHHVPADATIYDGSRGFPEYSIGSYSWFADGAWPISSGAGGNKTGFIYTKRGTHFGRDQDQPRWMGQRNEDQVNDADDDDLAGSNPNTQKIAAASARLGMGPLIGNPDPSSPLAGAQYAVDDDKWFWQSDNSPSWATAEADAALAATLKQTADALQAAKAADDARLAQEQAARDEAKAEQDAKNALAQSAADTAASVAKQKTDAAQADLDAQQRAADIAAQLAMAQGGGGDTSQQTDNGDGSATPAVDWGSSGGGGGGGGGQGNAGFSDADMATAQAWENPDDSASSGDDGGE